MFKGQAVGNTIFLKLFLNLLFHNCFKKIVKNKWPVGRETEAKGDSFCNEVRLVHEKILKRKMNELFLSLYRELLAMNS